MQRKSYFTGGRDGKMKKKEINKNIGIGADIESIGRFRRLNYAENDNFLNKVFTKNELEYCFSKKNAAPHLAARFSGKEAVFKALCSIGKFDVDHREVEIINDEKGVPIVKLNNGNLNNLIAKISLSHCADKAIAFAVIIKTDKYEKD